MSVPGLVEIKHLLLSGQFDTHNHNYGRLSSDGINYCSMECISESEIALIQNPQVINNHTPICQSSGACNSFEEKKWLLWDYRDV